MYQGADRYDIHLHLERPPLVRDLMEEVEKKARVTMMNQQLVFRGRDPKKFTGDDQLYFCCFQGQRLHQTPSRELEAFGIFNGNHIMLIGQKVRLLELLLLFFVFSSIDLI